MNFIDTPYLPKKEVCLFIADTEIENKTVIKPPSIDILPYSLRRHADLGIVIISKRKELKRLFMYHVIQQLLLKILIIYKKIML